MLFFVHDDDNDDDDREGDDDDDGVVEERIDFEVCIWRTFLGSPAVVQACQVPFIRLEPFSAVRLHICI